MSPSLIAAHVYDREITARERTSLSVLARHIPAGARVLDLGCGSGALGRFLAARDGAAAGPVDGLTISGDEAQLAAAHYRRVEVADLDACRLPEKFQAGGYDVIVCADVLEHIRQGSRVLAECKPLLAADGRLLLSIPNVGYAGLVAELMAGEFRYRTEGLLDETHLRFFTRQTLMRFLQDAGWAAARVETVERPLPDSEFRAAFDALPPAVARYLLALPDALAYQFIVTARPDADNTAATPPALPKRLPASALFSAELFLGADGQYDEARKLTVRGEIGGERQTLRFDLPPSPPLTSLKLDPADRPGFLYLYGCTLADHAGQALWQWAPGDPALADAPLHDLTFAPSQTEGRCLALLHGDDPSIELPIAPQILTQAAGGALSVELGWPMSADYLALDRLVGPLQELRRQAQALAALESENAGLRLQRLELILRSRHLRHERDVAQETARLVQSSRLFRATRPIANAKLRLERWLKQIRQALAGRPAAASPLLLTPPLPAPPVAPVDIIVPVYRGLQDTRRCVESVLRAACQTPWRLVLINDASPEPELTGWLRQAAAADARITLLENEQNLGFVGTVNRGMELSDQNDALLLNSDTEVADGWLDRLRAAAYSDRQVATVTPFSNNATICSYPRFCQDNDLPEGWSAARLDALFARVNAGQALDAPTGVGFCLYLRRAALNALGLFDAEIFGKGYGEENDFCIRAAKAGWRNLHALDVFVRHLGGVSFGANKTPGERIAQETLRYLHPHYEEDVRRFIDADPARPARHAVDMERLREEGKPVILAVLHHRLGGTERHVIELARLLHGKARFLVLRPTEDQQVCLRFAEETEAFEQRFTLAHEDSYAALLDTLRAFGVCHVHYHHRVDHVPAILDLARRLGVGYDFTAHDYYAICPRITLTGSNQTYCGEKGLTQCQVCLQEEPDIIEWRGENAAFINQARFVIAPSRDALARLLRYLPAAPAKLVPHTDIDLQTPLPKPRPPQLTGERPLKVAVIGALHAAKGANVLAEAALVAKETGAPVEFHLLGYGHRQLPVAPRARLTVHGRYAEADLPELLNKLQPDLVWFPAQWPETYCYVLSACLLGGWPVAATAIGAFPERLAGRPWTWLKPWDTPAAEWLAFFADIRQRYYSTGAPPEPPRPELPPLPESTLPSLPPRDWYAGPYLDGLAR
ncbi:MAG: methyltransferase domain-containing protein [Desulfovibrionaceae bacterium]|jgi:GT2 family glycosyltransferase/2-polyprenyl-3-methyl-5-hydroxy-6-metoxy-1,4-benzoquinol methylase/glycosyltransferase involved in cell wall biosynthesis|nr:methyltransferase domain-containing protein [Desulfovibrionaceae bacterium]